MSTETLNFQAEVKQLLHLVTHSLYSNKEIFLRELISNASDALDRLRFAALSDANIYENDKDLKIYISFDEKAQTITIRDNGIGMSREEVIANLGTIAKSGTREFLKSLTGDQAKDAHVIGQFGVGFYSSFVVSDKVTVKSRRAGLPANQGVVWESEGTGEYTIDNIELQNRGTEITLHIKKDDSDFLNNWRLRSIITKYSDHILFPIMMPKTLDEDKKKEKKDGEVEWEMVNRATALWTLPKQDIKEEEYKEFYKHVSHDFEDPLLYSHNRVEGKLEYTTLLYIPARAPFDLWQREHRYGLKLYVERVFIMDDAENLLPSYLRFVRGIVDSKDLPLNVSREILQNNKVIESIKSGVTKRVLDMLDKLAEEDKEKYAKLWTTFGAVLKEGPAEDFINREKIAKLLRFASTYTNSSEQRVSLDDYISRMVKDQDKIYYLIAENFVTAENSPLLEIFRKKGIEVLLLTDRIDEWLCSNLSEYKDKKLQSINKASLETDKLQDKEEKDKKEESSKTFKDTIKKMQKILDKKVKEVRLSSRLVDAAACLVFEDSSPSIHLQKILKAAQQEMPDMPPIFEINPDHILVQKLKDESDETRFADLTEILFAEALLAEGGQLQNPIDFVKRLNKWLTH
ncbi:MAG: molecular chaperone HtpG [Gammaproteobacteria bacterium]